VTSWQNKKGVFEMRLTVSAYSFEVLPLEACLSIAKHMGFKSVGLSGFHARGRASIEPEVIAVNPQGQADQVRALLDRYELECSDFFPQFGANPNLHSLNDPNPAIREKNHALIRGCAQFCKLLAVPGMTIIPGIDHLSRKHEENLQISGAELKRATQIAGEYGIEVRFEPHVGSVAPTPELGIRLVQEFAPDIKLALDFSHFLLQYISLERIYACIPYTGHVHVRPAREGKLQERYAENTIPWAEVISRLKAANYPGVLALEYVCSHEFDLDRCDMLYETWVTKEALLPYVGSP
jgi:sugar phosphate isomerase/epimerase